MKPGHPPAWRLRAPGVSPNAVQLRARCASAGRRRPSGRLHGPLRAFGAGPGSALASARRRAERASSRRPEGLLLPASASMRRPPGIKTFLVGRVHRRAKHRTAALPFALDEGPPEGPGACWGPTRSGAAIFASSSMAPAEGRSHPDGAVRSFDLLWTFLRSFFLGFGSAGAVLARALRGWTRPGGVGG